MFTHQKYPTTLLSKSIFIQIVQNTAKNAFCPLLHKNDKILYSTWFLVARSYRKIIGVIRVECE